ncbi:MAG: flagella basal body P-ring formation protein FlgA [Deltaproteobacteria bacterium]|nr:MAG: flagella basal body P-ring formation protein FlgA [Deltaproteobacteria bacterium]RLC16911.1 MAG: flagella basal body P-ring formation protein FlgA [Deltaproteobacteria bacterium]HHE74042.1 flagellar basal body P-ring formation protein FlgA [Desulfobacteraceae bacterium]
MMKLVCSHKQFQRVLRLGIWFALTLFVLSSAGLTSGAPVRAFIDMLPRVTVDNDPVLLGDIAVIRGQDATLVSELKMLVVGRAPLPGKSRQLEAAYVALRLKQNGIPVDQVALNETTPTTVVRNSTIVSRDQVKSVIRNALLREDFFQGRRGVVRDIRVTDDLVVPPGDLSYRVTFAEKSIRSNKIPVSVAVFVNGKQYRKIWATLLADILQEVVVLKHTMRRYQRITADDIQLVDKNLADIPQNAITSDQDILDKRITKSLLSGTVLRTDIVELPPLVKRGDIVTVKAVSGALLVTTLGKAKSKGRQGERIKIVNIDTKKELYGYVVDAKTVKVVF